MPFFSFSNMSQLFSLLYDLKQPTKQCVTYGSVLRNCACFLRKINLTGKKIKSARIILVENTCPIFLFIYKTFNLSIRKTQVLRRDSDFLK